MKIMIISDIHGDIDSLNKIIDLYKNDNYEHLIILGDLELNAKMGETLANFEKNITIVRGNCDLPIYDKYLNKKLYDIYVNKLNGFFVIFITDTKVFQISKQTNKQFVLVVIHILAVLQICFQLYMQIPVQSADQEII